MAGADLSLRSVDRFVAYWNPSLKVDGQGRATFDFVLPDNLTAWKVLVLAVTPDDRFGLGSGRLIATKDTELRPLLPNQVVDGDRFRAGFSVLNRASRPRTLAVTLEASGAARVRHTQSVTLAAFERQTVFVDCRQRAHRQRGGRHPLHGNGWRCGRSRCAERHAAGAAAPGHRHRRLTSACSTARRTRLPLRVPAGSLPGGEIAVQFTPSVLGPLDGAFRYLRDYPYQCWEQRLTRGVMAAQYSRLKPWLDPALQWPDPAASTEALFSEAASFQAPNGGMAFWQADDRHASPYLSAYTALAFEWLREAGLQPPAAVQRKLDRYLDGLLKKDAPGLDAEASASLRSMVLAVQARRGKAESGRAGSAGAGAAAHGAVRAGAVPGCRATRPTAPMPRPGRRWICCWRVASRAPAAGCCGRPTIAPGNRCWVPSCVRTARRWRRWYRPAMTASMPTPAPASCPATLVRAITAARGGREHWQNTQENVFCARALEAYARRYESAAPAMTLEALLDGQPFGKAAFTTPRDAPVTGNAADRGRRHRPRQHGWNCATRGRGGATSRPACAMSSPTSRPAPPRPASV